MKRIIGQLKTFIATIVLISIGVQLHAQVPGPVVNYPNKVLILGGVAHIGNGEVVQNSAIAIENGLITFVKDQMKQRLDVSQYDSVIYLNGSHVYPGFILPNNTMGITEIDAVRAARDFDDVGQYNPHIRSAIAYNAESKIIYTVRNNGILTTQVTPRGGVVSGASSVMALDGWGYEDAVVSMVDGFHLNWPKRFRYVGAWYASGSSKMMKNTEEEIASIISFFSAAKAYALTDNKEVNLKYESLKPLFRGNKTLYVHCNMSKEIMQVIRFKKELGIKRLVIVGGYESGMLTQELAENNIGVILRPTHSLPLRIDEDIHYMYKLPKVLWDGGVTFCMSTAGSMEAMKGRNLPFVAGQAVGYGLTSEQALQTITLNAAKVLGVESQLGSLEAGKRATFFISEGDALDMRTNNVIFAWVNGRPINLDDTQKQLYRKYQQRYPAKQ